MPAKNTPIRRIDQQNQQEDPRQASLLGAGNQSFSTQLTSVVEVPINLTAGATYIVYSHLTPTAAQELSWRNADSRTPETYLVQWSTQSNFANAVTVATPTPSITIDGLPTGTTIYYRVAARIAGQQSEWSASISAITATDTTPPAAVSNAQGQWSGKTGDLTITWTPPASPNYKDTRIIIRASPSGPVLREAYAVAGRYVWTRAQQAADTGGSYDSNVIVELTTRNTSNIFGSTVSINLVLSAPSTPTGLSVSWNGGVCTITWNTADVDYYRLTVDSVTRNIGYTNSYVYTLEQNAIDHGGTPSPTLSISLRAVDALNQQSGAATINTTAPLPAQPSGLTTSWASDNGTAEADCVISWTRVSGVTYRLTVDSVARNVGQVDRFVYSFAQNQQEHGGNAAASLAISLVAVDPFNRLSTAATTTATNTAPPALTAPSVQGFFSSCRFSWSPSTARDLLRYELDVRVNSVSVGVFSLTDTTYTFETSQSGSIDARVRAVDRFGQAGAWSSYSTSVSLTNASQFVQDLRQGVTYRDSVNSSQSALAALKDSNLTSGGITYASSTTWRWIEADHNREIRHQTTTLATSASVSIYLGTSLDGSTWTWYHGGSVGAGVWVPASSTTSETTAQSGAVSVSGIVKIRLSAPVQCRFVRLGMRNTSASYTIREFYPRSLVQSDDIAGETLSAISANLGTITAGVISSVSIDAATITGSLIQTNTSNPRIVFDNTSFRLINSSNVNVVNFSTITQSAEFKGSDVNLIIGGDGAYFYFPSDYTWLDIDSSQVTVGKSTIPAVSILARMMPPNPVRDFLIGASTLTIAGPGDFGHILFKVANTADHLIYFYATKFFFGHPKLSDNITLPPLATDTEVSFYAQGTKTVSFSFGQSNNNYLLGTIFRRFEFFLDGNSNVTFRSYGNTNNVLQDLLSFERLGRGITFGGLSSRFLTVFPHVSIIRLHQNPIISSFAHQYTVLKFGGPAGQYRDFAFGTTNTDANSPTFSYRWVVRLTPDAETGNAAGSDFAIRSYNDDSSGRHIVLYVTRSSGHVGFGGIPGVSGGAAGSIDVYGDVRVRGVIRQKVNWTTFSLASNWSDMSSTTGDPAVAYRIYADNTVELRGMVRLVSGTSWLIAVLPTAARPTSTRRAATAVWTTVSPTPVIVGASLHILPNGELHYNGPSLTLNNNYVMLYCRYSLD